MVGSCEEHGNCDCDYAPKHTTPMKNDWEETRKIFNAKLEKYPNTRLDIIDAAYLAGLDASKEAEKRGALSLLSILREEMFKDFEKNFDGEIVNDGENEPYIMLAKYRNTSIEGSLMYSVDALVSKIKLHLLSLIEHTEQEIRGMSPREKILFGGGSSPRTTVEDAAGTDGSKSGIPSDAHWGDGKPESPSGKGMNGNRPCLVKGCLNKH